MGKVKLSHLIPQEFLALEAMKTLRTNVMFSGKNVCAIGVTSYCASEGKSTISLQLAVSLSQMGKKVLLLDTDLRKSVLHRRVQFPDGVKGLSHYLSGMCQLDELIFETDVQDLFILFAGVRVANAAELLGSDAFKELIPLLKETFDYIIVDTPPLGQVIDCAVMASSLDGTILVIDATKNSYKLERRIQNQIVKSNGKVLGVVLNKVDFKDKSGYYGKAYGGKYGYGGYGTD